MRQAERGRGWRPSDVLLLAAALPLLVLAAIANPDRFNPDAVAYLALARHWLEGRWGLAVSGYWGPLFPWLSALLLPLTEDAILAGRVAMILSGFVFLLGGLRLFGALGLPRESRAAGGVCLLACGLAWSAQIMTPDLLMSGLLMLGVAVGLGPGWRAGAAAQMLSGALFGLAYLAKTVALPLGAGMLLACAAWQAMASGDIRLALRGALRGALAMAVVAAPWIVALSLDAGRPSFGTSGSINFAIAGPATLSAVDGRLDPQHPAFTRFHAPEAGRITAWEKPDPAQYEAWSPLADAASARHFLRVVRTNLEAALRTLQDFDALSLGLAALLLVPLLSGGSARPWQLGLVPVGLVVGAYLTSVAQGETRYFLPAYPFLLAAALGLAWTVATAARDWARWRRAVAAALVAAAFLLPLRHDVGVALLGRANPGLLAAREVAGAVHAQGIAGGVASVGELAFAAIFAAFLSERPFMGTEAALPPPGTLESLGVGVVLVPPGSEAERALDAAGKPRLPLRSSLVAAFRLQ